MPLPLAAIGAGVKIGGALIQGIQGLLQGRKARKMAKENIRPEYEIPKEIESNLRLAKMRKNQGMGGDAYAKQLRDIWRNRNAAVSGAQDRRSGLAAISATQQAANDASLKLNIADDNTRRDNERQYMGQNQIMAGYRDKAWDYNKRQKFEENAAAIRALYGASRENGNRAMNGIMEAGTMAAWGGNPFAKQPNYDPVTGLAPRTKRRTQQDWTNYEDE
jgi:hypothetical protein